MELALEIAKTVGVLGILVWHLWYTTTKVMPDMQDKFLSTINHLHHVNQSVAAELTREVQALRLELTEMNRQLSHVIGRKV